LRKYRTFTKGILERLYGMNVMLFCIQLFLSWIAFGIFCWNGVLYYKKWITRESVSGLYLWTNIFFHPVESSTLNYMFVCVLLGASALFIYVMKQRLNQFLHKKLASVNPILIIMSAIFTIAILLSVIYQSSPRMVILESLFLSLIPVIIIIVLSIDKKAVQKTVSQKKCLLLILVFVMFIIICIEPLAFMIGPVRVLNEYPDIFSDTKIKGEYVNNKLFVENFSRLDACAVYTFFMLKDKFKHANPRTETEIDLHKSFLKHRFINLDTIQSKYINYLAETNISFGNFSAKELSYGSKIYLLDNFSAQELSYGLKVYPNFKSCVKHIHNVDVESVKQFYNANFLEYFHQNIGRGQINHIGHILNPLNEYELGKSPDNIYLQYGLGNTFIMKWIMDFFGGISIHNYYKIYVLYIIYYLSFLVMVWCLFKDKMYALGAYCMVPICFFMQGYIALTLGPGIIPSIHLFDTSVIIFLIAFFRRNNHAYLAIAVALTLGGTLINRQFGAALMMSLIASLGMYSVENKTGKLRYLWLVALGICMILDLIVLRSSSVGNASQVFPYFLAGLFSWPAKPLVVILTIIYLIASYGYLIIMKNQRFYLKYIFIFVFIYTQIFLLYFYWSGLNNHLPAILPFCWLQLFIMLYIAQKELLQNDTFTHHTVKVSATILTILSLICVVPSAGHFYWGKLQFLENFERHKTYTWKMDRAQIISTVDPRIMENAALLLKRYSAKESPGIYILSKYDGILPFLAHRYSVMPFFEMNTYLFSKKEYEMVVNTIMNSRPRYLFVDNNLNNYGSDPWSNLYTDDLFSSERASRMGRYELLYKIFCQVENNYKKIDQSELISVYERRN